MWKTVLLSALCSCNPVYPSIAARSRAAITNASNVRGSHAARSANDFLKAIQCHFRTDKHRPKDEFTDSTEFHFVRVLFGMQNLQVQTARHRQIFLFPRAERKIDFYWLIFKKIWNKLMATNLPVVHHPSWVYDLLSRIAMTDAHYEWQWSNNCVCGRHNAMKRLEFELRIWRNVSEQKLTADNLKIFRLRQSSSGPRDRTICINVWKTMFKINFLFCGHNFFSTLNVD